MFSSYVCSYCYFLIFYISSSNYAYLPNDSSMVFFILLISYWQSAIYAFFIPAPLKFLAVENCFCYCSKMGILFLSYLIFSSFLVVSDNKVAFSNSNFFAFSLCSLCFSSNYFKFCELLIYSSIILFFCFK